MLRIVRLLAVCLLACISVQSAALAQTESARVILVLDASGSMWGQIEGRTKIEIARDTVGKILSTWRAEDALGLIAYGHRSKGDCGDIELLIEPGPLDAGTFASTVNRLNPKGKTPMTEAVRRAAEALKSTERAATVILVSDGEETCNADPCAVARELEAAGVGLTVHTVGFDVADPKTRAELQCLAEGTGGMFVTAGNADELEQALRTTVAAAQETPPELAAAPQPAPAPAPVPAPEEPAAAISLRAMAVATEGGATLDEGMAWEIFQRDGEGAASGDAVDYGYGTPYEPTLEPGIYILRALQGMAQVDQTVEIEAGRVSEVTVVMKTGAALVRAFETEESTDPVNSAFELSSLDGTLAHTNYGTEATFVAPAGQWRLAVSYGQARIETEIAITAGETSEFDIVVGAGTVNARALYAAGGPDVETGVFFEIFRASAPDGDVVAYSYEPLTSFVVPAGDYIVHVTVGEAKASAPVTVPAGGEVSTVLVADAGILAVAAGAEFNSCEVFDARTAIDGSRVSRGYWYGGEHQVALPAGDYVIKCSREGGSSEEVAAMVKAGERTQSSL